MSFVNFINVSRNLGDEDFAWLEDLIGVILPLAFVNHYSMFNGGEPEIYLYKVGETIYVVQEFIPIRYGKPGNKIEEIYLDLAKNEKILPEKMLPFAIDPAGDYYCLDLETGSVSLYRSEYFPDIKKCITYLASSIDEFVDGLVDDEG